MNNRNGKVKLLSLTLVISVTVILALGQETNTITLTTFAQTLGKPFFEEKGKITGQKEIGTNTTQISYSSNGTMNGNIPVTTSGNFVSISKGNNVTYNHGQALMTAKDGTEIANYTFLAVGKISEEGKPIFNGVSVYSTNSTGKLGFLNNMVGIFKVELDKMGNFVNKEWEWK
jgi:hypothetical protein